LDKSNLVKKGLFLRKYLGIGGRYAISRFWTHKPIFLTHSVTARCNCRCQICDVWRRETAKEELDTREIFRILDEAEQLNFVGYVAFGGEPLMRSDILEILGHSHNCGFYTSLITNGTLLSNFADKLAKTVDLTWVSLDYDSKYHDTMRNLQGTFEKAVKGISDLRQAGGRIVINCVLSQLNRDIVPRMGKLAQELGVRIAFDPMEIFPGCNEQIALTSNQKRQVFSEIAKLKQEGYPILNSKEYINYQQVNGRYSCAQPRIFLKVYEDGKVKPFWCQKTREVIGDLRRQSLSEFLVSNPYKEFQKSAWKCCQCKNSCQVETSMFYSIQNFFTRVFQPKNSILKFIKDYALT
jgi:MoaA/NifB/PqqE/SkfB family radical SAM enzyme